MHGHTLVYELEKLERIITYDLVRIDQTVSSSTEPDILQITITGEVERVKMKFIHEVFSFEDERHLQRYIQLHQQQLIRLADQLVQLEQFAPTNHARITLVKFTYNAIEELLHFIEQHFTKYFDQDTKAPQNYISITGKETSDAFAEIQLRLKEQNVDSVLLNLVLKPLRKIPTQPAHQITYRRLIYLKCIAKELRLLSALDKEARECNAALQSMLLYLNFNSISYFNYYINSMRLQVADIDTVAGQIEKLSYLLKTINQTQVKPEVAYHYGDRSLKTQLVDWIAEEINYIEHTQMLSDRAANVKDSALSGFRIKSEMSVSQLAYLLRIFVELKIFQNKNVSDLIRFFASSFQTKRLESISLETFRVRYYNPDEGSRKALRMMLLQAIDFINRK